MSKSIKLKNNVYLDGKSIKQTYIQVANNQNESITNEWQELSLNSWSDGWGNGLTLSNNKIIIGSGIKKIRVSGAIFCENVGSWLEYAWALVEINGNVVVRSIMSGATKYYNTLVIPPHSIDVAQGDKINVMMNNPNYSNGSFSVRHGADNTWLLVEVIG